jgi:hypothetical protein
MNKRIIISESEKTNILEMYGLIVEQQLNQELLDYANDYIDNTSCDQIYQDMLKCQQAVNNGEITLSNEDKNELDDNIKKIKSYKGFACGTIKSKMKSEFQKQSTENPEKLKVMMCWFSKNVHPPSSGQPLKSCQAETPVDNTQTQVQQQTQDNRQQQTQVNTQTTNQNPTNNTQKSSQQPATSKTSEIKKGSEPATDDEVSQF